MKRIFIIALTLLCCSACKKMEYSPYQKPLAEEGPYQLNQINLEKLMSGVERADDTVTIVYSGDSQRYYDELEPMIKKVNELRNVDFMVLCGDIADFGLLKEYQWVTQRLAKLTVPYFGVMGNHDFTANGGEIFTHIFGPIYSSFTYKDYKFIFHDTNGREHGFDGSTPDMDWLARELNDPAPRWFVGMSHVPPYNEDFDRAVEMPYKSLFAAEPRFIASLHGHLHGYTDAYYYEDHVRYMTANAIVKPEFLVLKLIDGKILTQMVSY